MSQSENTIEAIAKVLGEPAFAELPENAWKIRTNLILAAVVSIVIVFGDLHIEPDSQILGLKFKGLSDTILTNGLIAVVAYLLLHFVWASLDAMLEWRIRVTGTRVAFQTTARLASEHGDYPNDPRQSTLYNWWKDEARKVGNLRVHMQELESRLSKWEAELQAKLTEGADAVNIRNAVMSIASSREDIGKLSRDVKAAAETIESSRIPTSLKRFDSWYELFLRSQNLRWLIIDFFAPVLAGSYALLLLVWR